MIARIARAARVAAGLSLLAALAACGSPKPPLTVEPLRGVPVDQLTFRITQREGTGGTFPIESIMLVRMAGQGMDQRTSLVWMAAHLGDQSFLHPPLTVPAMASLPGYSSAIEAVMRPGEYEIRVQADTVTAKAQFRVSAEGRIE